MRMNVLDSSGGFQSENTILHLHDMMGAHSEIWDQAP